MVVLMCIFIIFRCFSLNLHVSAVTTIPVFLLIIIFALLLFSPFPTLILPLTPVTVMVVTALPPLVCFAAALPAPAPLAVALLAVACLDLALRADALLAVALLVADFPALAVLAVDLPPPAGLVGVRGGAAPGLVGEHDGAGAAGKLVQARK